MTRSVAILQSNYIPWKGYFDLINSVDEFILCDDVQTRVRSRGVPIQMQYSWTPVYRSR